MKKLTINRGELQLGFELDSEVGTGYLDTQTGEVLIVDPNLTFSFQSLEIDLDEADLDTITEALRASDSIPEWQREVLIHIAPVLYGNDPERYLELPGQDTPAEYKVMEAFIDAVEDEHLQELLSVAIQGKGAFGRFKDVLQRYPEAQQRWYRFQEEQGTQRMIAWLHARGIDPDFV